jgi:hypothetical protein
LNFSAETSRRELLQRSACGFGSLALSAMLGRGAGAASPATANPLIDRPGHLPAKAKRVIFLFMQGGPSQVDTFDPKPELQKRSGEKVQLFNARYGKVQEVPLYGSPWEFQNYGECGQPVSQLFPHMAKHVDDMCFLHGMHTEGVAHGPATLFLHTGATNLIRPSMGSWITYGLGTENNSMPGFVTINAPSTKGGPRNFGNAFLPADFQGTPIGRVGLPATKATIEHLANPRLTEAQQRRQFDLLRDLSRSQIDERGVVADKKLEAVIRSGELAFRMQTEAPERLDVDGESKATKAMYGIGEEPTDDFGRQCLMARMMAEAGVRYIQVSYSDHNATPKWDQHSKLKNHEKHAANTDKPVAGLLADLKARGLLEDTLVWWGGEFGRTPFSQNNDGRDHNPRGFTVWLAGGGVKTGYRHGATDEIGNEAIDGKVHMHDLHATVLHLLGLDHERLTYRYAGRDFRLTDVAGRVVDDVIA